MREVELKIVPHEPASAIWARVRKLSIATGKRATRTLRSIYFDTPDHRLRDARMSLRVRRVGGRWLQTVKRGGKLQGGLSQTREIEVPISRGQIDLNAIDDSETRRALFDVIAGARLEPVCETAMKRTVQILQFGEARVEMAFDNGTIAVHDKTAPWSEVEFELLEGHPRELFEIARMIFPSGGVTFSRRNKSARGYMLAENGVVDEPLAPRSATAISIDSDDDIAEAFTRTAADCFEQIAINTEAVRRLDDPEAAHQLRVGLRRLRSALTIFGPLLESSRAAALTEGAKWLAAEVGRLRDVEACGLDIVAPQATAYPDEASLSFIQTGLHRRAETLRSDLREVLAGERVQAFLFDLASFAALPAWSAGAEPAASPSAREFAATALDTCWRKVRKRARKIETLSEEQRHELRKTLKRLRYAVEFLAGYFAAKRTRPFLKRLKSLQTVFGQLNDAAMTRVLLSDPDLIDTASPTAQRGAGWLIGASQAESALGWREAKAAWRKLADADKFWR